MNNQVAPIKKSKEKIKHKIHGGISELHDQVNHLFESFMKSFGRFRHGDIQKMEFSPDFDIVDTEDAYDVRAELSGMDEKDVDVALSKNVLNKRREERRIFIY